MLLYVDCSALVLQHLLNRNADAVKLLIDGAFDPSHVDATWDTIAEVLGGVIRPRTATVEKGAMEGMFDAEACSLQFKAIFALLSGDAAVLESLEPLEPEYLAKRGMSFGGSLNLVICQPISPPPDSPRFPTYFPQTASRPAARKQTSDPVKPCNR